jgi:ABC-type dipeptide/oligopeptide/nickel transport system ATPase component
MASGQVVDHGPAEELFIRPGSDVTTGLLAAVPTLPTVSSLIGAHHE